MYFSLIQPLRGSELGAARAWNGVYSDHQWLWQFFSAPDGSQSGSPRRFIYRRHDDGVLARYYVVSEEVPQSPSTDWQVQSKPYAPAPQVGSTWQFELRANPTITTSYGLNEKTGKKRQYRHDVVMHAKRKMLEERNLRKWEDWKSDDKPSMGQLTWQACSAWLESRAAQIGVEFDLANLQVESYQQYREPRKKNGEEGHDKKERKEKGHDNSLRFSSVDFIGALQVRDPQLLAKALTLGIGHAKGFGCGLLLIRPLE